MPLSESLASVLRTASAFFLGTFFGILLLGYIGHWLYPRMDRMGASVWGRVTRSVLGWNAQRRQAREAAVQRLIDEPVRREWNRTVVVMQLCVAVFAECLMLGFGIFMAASGITGWEGRLVWVYLGMLFIPLPILLEETERFNRLAECYRRLNDLEIDGRRQVEVDTPGQ